MKFVFFAMALIFTTPVFAKNIFHCEFTADDSSDSATIEFAIQDDRISLISLAATGSGSYECDRDCDEGFWQDGKLVFQLGGEPNATYTYTLSFPDGFPGSGNLKASATWVESLSHNDRMYFYSAPNGICK